MEITIKIDPKSKQAKAFLEYLKVLPFVKIKGENYSSEFTKKIRKGEADIKEGKTTRLNPNDIWENIL